MKRFLSLAAIVVVVGLVVGSPALADGLEPVDRLTLASPDKGPFLVEPGTLTLGPEGQLAVWDRGLQQFFFLDATSERPSGAGRPTSFETVLERQQTMGQLRRLGLSRDPKGLWDRRGRFWVYDPEVAARAGTVPLHVVKGDSGRRSVPGPFRALAISDRGWLAQPTSSVASTRRYRFASAVVSRDTLPVKLEGRLVGSGPDGRIYTRENDRVRLYDSDGLITTHRFVNLQDVSVDGKRVYVLAGNNRVVQTNARLSVQFTFYFDRNRELHDLAVHRRRAYLLGSSGLYRARLDDSGGSFFSSSSTLQLERLARSLSSRFRRDHVSRLWTQQEDSTYALSLHLPGERVLPARFDGRRLERADQPTSLSEAPLGRFRRPGGPRGHQGANGRFFYYFPDRNLVESYDTATQNRRRTRVDFGSFDVLRDVSFLGADAQRILFEGRVVDPERGLRRALIIYDWQGELQRVTHLYHPEGWHRLPDDTTPVTWRYDGKGHVYALHDRYLQAFDLHGYPAGVITGVVHPRNVVKRDDYLFVVDMRGWRVSVYRRNDVIRKRYASPPGDPEITGVAPVDDSRAILSARVGSNQRPRILEYDHAAQRYEVVFQHPRRSLRYPVAAPGGDTLFFWGRRSPQRPWTLYRSGLQKYAAQSTGQQARVRGPGFYNPSPNMLLVPVESRDTAPRYHYVIPGRYQAPLKGSERLELLVPGGFMGYYGVQERDGEYALVSGYLSRPSDTSGWTWNVAETLWVSSDPIHQVVPRGDNLYLSVTSHPGFARLGVLSVEDTSRESGSAAESRSVRWIHQARGRLRWVSTGTHGEIRVLQRPSPDRGLLMDLFRNTDPPRGGIQGQLQSRDPADLKGVPMRVDPGGYLMRTEAGGRFSVDDLAAGYVRLISRSHRYHVNLEDWLRVPRGEFTVRSSLPVQSGDDLVLLERGLKYYRQGQKRRARISLQAFGELVQGGPSDRWAASLLEDLYWHQGRIDDLFSLFRRHSGMFSPEERMRLLQSVKSREARRVLYRHLEDGWNDELSTVLAYLRQRAARKGNAPKRPRPLFDSAGLLSSTSGADFPGSLPIMRAD